MLRLGKEMKRTDERSCGRQHRTLQTSQQVEFSHDSDSVLQLRGLLQKCTVDIGKINIIQSNYRIKD